MEEVEILTKYHFLFVSLFFVLFIIFFLPSIIGSSFPQLNISNDLSGCTNITAINFIFSIPSCILSPVKIFVDYVNILIALHTNPFTSWLGFLIDTIQIIDIFIVAELIRGVGSGL